MITNPPKVYIKHNWENRQGFKYKQPIDYCNGIELTYQTISNFETIFGVTFKQAQKESHAYNQALKQSKFYLDLWKNNKIRNQAFSKIYQFNLSGKSGTGSNTTPLFSFEIYMMNDGFKMLAFCELSALNPGISIVADKQDGDYIINPKGFSYNRCYQKKDYFIYLAFGIEIFGKKTNFYFQTNKSHHYFQVDNNINNYQAAINGNLKPLDIK